MSDPIITAAPTMANPDAFHTVPELREELHCANRMILKLSDQLHNMTQVTQSVCDHLAHVAVLHMKGEHEQVRRELDAIVERHVRMMPKTSGQVH